MMYWVRTAVPRDEPQRVQAFSQYRDRSEAVTDGTRRAVRFTALPQRGRPR